MLLEHVRPGTKLVELLPEGDDEATLIAAGVMQRLWRPPPERGHRLIPLRRWFRELLDHRQSHDGPGRFPTSLLDRGVDTAEDLLATQDLVVLHGDLHHFNILRSEREPWLAIDPKGLVGDRCFELAALVRNPVPNPPPLAVARRRIAFLSEALDLDRERVNAWCFAEAMLNAAWSHDVPGDEFERRLAWADLTLRL
jgi:streptomycin 6-kinase